MCVKKIIKLKVKQSIYFVEKKKKKNFNKIETVSKMENPAPFLERWILCLSLFKNHNLEVRL